MLEYTFMRAPDDNQIGFLFTCCFDYFSDKTADDDIDPDLKALLKKTAARTLDDLFDAIASSIDTFTPQECRNYFLAAGYDFE